MIRTSLLLMLAAVHLGASLALLAALEGYEVARLGRR